MLVFEKRLPDSTIQGVGDSPYQRYAESATLRLNDTESRRLSASLICGVDDSPHYRYGVGYWIFLKKTRCIGDTESRPLGESPTPRIVESGSRRLRVSFDTESRRLPVSLSRGVDDSVFQWFGESLVEKKISLASIFRTLNCRSMPFKDHFGQKLARDVIYYQNIII